MSVIMLVREKNLNIRNWLTKKKKTEATPLVNFNTTKMIDLYFYIKNKVYSLEL